MKIKDGFVLRQVADTWVVMPLGQQSLDFNGMLTLNETGALLWKALEKGGDREAMAEVLTAEYEVTKEAALQDVDVFLLKLQETGCVE
jgi:hypothetical protein